MADIRMVRIAIDLTENNGQPAQPQQTELEDSNGKTKEGKTLLKSVILNQGFQTAKRLVIQSVETNLNRQFALNEDYMGETTFNNAKNVISKVASYGSSIISSTIYGASVGGVVGAVIGAGISSVGIGVSEFISVQGKMSQTFRSLNASNIETQYARARAGLIDGSNGTEN